MVVIFSFINRYSFIFFSLIVFLTPLFWQRLTSLNFGGDSSRLYLIFPLEWILNYSLNIYSFSYTNHSPQDHALTYQLIFYYFLNSFFNEKISILIDYSLVALLSYWSAFFILKDLNKQKNFLLFVLPLIYTFSVNYAFIIFNNGGTWIYVFSVFPLVLRCFFNFIYYSCYKNYYYFFLLTFIYSSIFSLKNISWSLPLFVLIFLLYINKIKYFKNHNFINLFKILFCFIILNLPTLYGSFIELYNLFTSNMNVSFEIFSTDRYLIFKDNLKLLNNFFYPMFLSTNYGEPFVSQNYSFLKINIILSTFFYFPIFYIFLRSNYTNVIKRQKLDYILIIFIFYFILINMGFKPFNYIFDVIFYYVPFFHMFSSYSSKFSFPFCLIFLVLIYLCLNNFIIKFIKYKIYILLFFIFLTIIIIFSTLKGNASFLKLSLWGSDKIYSIDNLDSDYLKILNHIKLLEITHSNGKILTLPFSREYSVQLINNYAYAGPTFASVYTGVYEFLGEYFHQAFLKNIHDDIQNKNLNDFNTNLENFNISYIILNKNDLSRMAYYFQNLNFFNENTDYIEKIISLSGYKLEIKVGNYYLYFKEKTFFNSFINECFNFKIINSSIININKICEDKKYDLILTELGKSINLGEWKIYNNHYFTYFFNSLKNNKEKINANSIFIVYKKQLINYVFLLISFFSFFLFIIYYFFKYFKNK
jgi:hypothetical protein